MNAKTLRGFQTEAVNSGVDLFTTTKRLLDAAGADVAGKTAAINHNGYLLIEAPTGSGKTLMVGTIVERFSHEEDVVWFWFAPFKGVVGQTAAVLREEFHGLRLRELADDRSTAMSRRGDVFVTTWQTVATRVKDKRNVRKEGDTNPSIDTLIEALRDQGLRIGVVVDEAHSRCLHPHDSTGVQFRRRSITRPGGRDRAKSPVEEQDLRSARIAPRIARQSATGHEGRGHGRSGRP